MKRIFIPLLLVLSVRRKPAAKRRKNAARPERSRMDASRGKAKSRLASPEGGGRNCSGRNSN